MSAHHCGKPHTKFEPNRTAPSARVTGGLIFRFTYLLALGMELEVAQKNDSTVDTPFSSKFAQKYFLRQRNIRNSHELVQREIRFSV